VLDPIDGTRGFISGTASWGVLISLEDENGPVLGVIDQPYTRERFFGGFGTSELTRDYERHNLQVRKCGNLTQATLLSTYPEVGTQSERLSFEKVRDQVRLTRYGLDCYGYALLALGQVDLVIEAGLSPYDISAPIAVIEAAGGIVTNWQGEPAHKGGQDLRSLHKHFVLCSVYNHQFTIASSRSTITCGLWVNNGFVAPQKGNSWAVG